MKKNSFIPRRARYTNIYVYVGKLMNAIPVTAPNRMGNQWGISLGSTFIPVQGDSDDKYMILDCLNGAIKLERCEGGDILLFAPVDYIDKDPEWEYEGWGLYVVTEEQIERIKGMDVEKKKGKEAVG